MDTLVFLCGIHALCFAVLHLFFYKLLRWRTELLHLSRLNLGVVLILNARLTYLFFGLAWLCFFHSKELLSTSFDQYLFEGVSLFWVGRLVE